MARVSVVVSRLRARLLIAVAALAMAACSREQAPPAAPAASPDASARTPRTPRGDFRAAEAQRGGAALPAHLDAVATAADTFDSLRARYGDGAVMRATIPAPEGEQYEGWLLFPADAARRVEVSLDESNTHPAVLDVETPSAWRRSDGVRIGMDTRELQALNGRPFAFAGFDWDYGGVVMDWKGGALDATGNRKGRVAGRVHLCAPEGAPENYPSGDSDFMSDLPVVQAHPALVCGFGVALGD